MTSLRRQLLLYLLVGVVLAWVVGGIMTYRAVLRESDGILDYHLRQVALSLGNQHFGDDLPALDGGEEARLDLVVQVWDARGARLYLSHPHTDLPGFAQFGLTTLSTAEGRWRVFSTQIRGQVIQVAQPMSVRERLAADMAMRVLLPFLVLIPVLGLLVWLAIGRGLGPLAAVARAVTQRTPDSLDAVELPFAPDELRPLLDALNALLARLGEALDKQRAFTADAAHELRTPLAALQLQVQLIERCQTEDERTQAIERLKEGLKRATHVVDQLLTLARQEGEVVADALAPVDLRALAARVMAELAPLAQARAIDLGMVGEDMPVMIKGEAVALRILIANLLGNALRYTPEDGRVDVGVLHKPGTGVILEISDTGPGIPEAERARVFDRFYRGEHVVMAGSGLGLAIVKRVAERHGARVTLLAGPDGIGLRVSVAFPDSD